ncbi:hypothetical protein GCM10017771_51730 [Streptomyces capitiformicae]|uniref:Uncharacterized protein n=1 Tax=Streptomyces capitiformicae TaxID=2014920 RepID=A0A918Z315_9ACTN|nr:hypothetical protein GCM10017771_51730 [Streptomyces capitiformicae]
MVASLPMNQTVKMLRNPILIVLLDRKSASGLTELLAPRLRQRGLDVQIERLHVHLPRVLKARTADPLPGPARPEPVGRGQT